MWTSIIQAYSTNGKLLEALKLYDEMKTIGVALDEYTYSAIIRVLSDLTNWKEGIKIYETLMVFILISLSTLSLLICVLGEIH